MVFTSSGEVSIGVKNSGKGRYIAISDVVKCGNPLFIFFCCFTEGFILCVVWNACFLRYLETVPVKLLCMNKFNCSDYYSIVYKV